MVVLQFPSKFRISIGGPSIYFLKTWVRKCFDTHFCGNVQEPAFTIVLNLVSVFVTLLASLVVQVHVWAIQVELQKFI